MNPIKILFMDDDPGTLPTKIEQQRLRERYGLEVVLADPADPVTNGIQKWQGDPSLIGAVVGRCLASGHAVPRPWEHVATLQGIKPIALIAVCSPDLTPEDRRLALERRNVVCFNRGESLEPFFEQIAFTWAMTTPEIQQRHGGQVVAVHAGRIWGAGRNHLEALRQAQAQPDFPGRTSLTFVVVPYYVPEVGSEFSEFLQEKLQKTYGGKVLAVYQNQVLGAGRNRETAWRRAQEQLNCPAPHEVLFVLVPQSQPAPETTCQGPRFSLTYPFTYGEIAIP